MKTCKKCLITKKISDFYTRKDGYVLTLCKTCDNARLEESRKRRGVYKTEKHRALHAQQIKRYNQRHPEKILARSICREALKKGTIKRMPCEVCASEYRIEAHHDDYSKPLQVKWLCKKHHMEIHHHLNN